MHSTAILSAGFIGLSVNGFLSSYRPMILGIASVFSLFMVNHVVALSVLIMLWGLDTFWSSRLARRRSELNEQETELFLQRLSRMLKARGSLAYALDDLARADSRIRLHSDPQQVLEELAHKWPTDAMRVVSISAKLANRHGGSLDDIIEHVMKHMTLSRRWRFQRRLEEMTLESTVLILALSPYIVAILFAMVLPEFYGALARTVSGQMVLTWIGVVTFVVLQLLGRHIRNGDAV